MVFSVVEAEETTAEGTLNYKNCKYDSGKAMIGHNGTWKAQHEKKKDPGTVEDSAEMDLDTDEYVYSDDK